MQYPRQGQQPGWSANYEPTPGSRWTLAFQLSLEPRHDVEGACFCPDKEKGEEFSHGVWTLRGYHLEADYELDAGGLYFTGFWNGCEEADEHGYIPTLEQAKAVGERWAEELHQIAAWLEKMPAKTMNESAPKSHAAIIRKGIGNVWWAECPCGWSCGSSTDKAEIEAIAAFHNENAALVSSAKAEAGSQE